MLRVYGIPVDEPGVRRIIATRLIEGTPAARRAAEQLTKGVERGLYAVGLSPDERDAVLSCLEEAATDPLAELRGALLRDHRSRFPDQHP